MTTTPTPRLTTLSYSGGKQSHALLEMVLSGVIPIPDNFIVTNADPGMENSNSYRFVDRMRSRCHEAGIPFLTAKTPLYHDLMTFKERGMSRIDNPPYWTRNRVTGKKGKLRQRCTSAYKVQPMRRLLRDYISVQFNVSKRAKRGIPQVETWIGFSADEQNRANKAKSDVKFITLRFPLIEMGLTKEGVEKFFRDNHLETPPPSVCNACFSNGLTMLRDMYFNRTDDWDSAVAVDESIRDLRSVGVEDECFVSQTLIPLRDLPKVDFLSSDPVKLREYKCNTGACFI